MHDIRTRDAEALLEAYEARRARMLEDIDAEMAGWFVDFPAAETEWATVGPGKAIFHADIAAAVGTGARGWLRESEVRALSWSFDPSTIRCPVRAFHGDRDSLERLDNLERILARIPDASVTVYSGGDHLSPLLHPEQLLAAATGMVVK